MHPVVMAEGQMQPIGDQYRVDRKPAGRPDMFGEQRRRNAMIITDAQEM